MMEAWSFIAHSSYIVCRIYLRRAFQPGDNVFMDVIDGNFQPETDFPAGPAVVKKP